jgi:oligopeptide transport system permease protein
MTESTRHTLDAEDVAATDEAQDQQHLLPDRLRAEGDVSEARSLGQDAWRQLRRNPLFWISAVMIVIFMLMSFVPQLFTNTDPAFAELAKARQTPNSDAWFGRDIQGYDIYSRCIYGARASIMVGVGAALGTMVFGSLMGLVGGYVGGWVDTLISRVGDIFFAIPLLLGGIIFLSTFRGEDPSYLGVVSLVVIVLIIFGWPSLMRLMRSSVLQVKPNDYVQAARALGASPLRIIRSHVLPNAMAPVIVVSTINLGVYISVEATLSFLGIGLVPPAISWGTMIGDGLVALRAAPHILLFPAAFLSLAVLSFIMLGDAVRDAFDPKAR